MDPVGGAVGGAVAGEIAKGTIGHVEREAGYFLCFRSNTNNFSTKIGQLRALRSNMQTKVDAANDGNEVIKATVQEWMKRVDDFLAQATRLSDEAGTINRWFKGWCCFRFNLCFGQTAQASELSDQAAVDSSCCCCKCCPRFSLGRRAKKDIIIIQGLCDEGSAFGTDVSDPKPAQALKLRGTENFSSFASRVSTAEEILKALLDDAISLVGIHGMPGVGKTTLIKAIAKQVKEEQLFQEVVVVIVSQDPDPIKLQGDIAEALDLSLTGNNLSRRADRLSERLSQDTKTTLVILDDVWDRIELSEAGIPYKNKGKCCKVVFTTRERDVCGKMQADAQIEVALLSEEDSWVLFCQKSGTVATLSIARELLNECKCLPLAIITLGLALSNKNEEVCANALQQLRKSNYEDMSSVDSSIKLSYNFLTNESKVCFLFCSLFPEDHRIELDTLLSYVMGEKLLKDVDTYEEGRGKLYNTLDKLVSSGLLLRDEDRDIMMHDVVRDMAISIAAKEERYIVKAGRNWRYWPDMELGSCKRLSMMHNSINHLPSIPIIAPHLQALFLNNNRKLKELSSDVFAEMKSLMTLDLSETTIESLPPSLSCLQNLRTLVLNSTHLTNLSPTDKLEKLEVLSLGGLRNVEGFPEEMGNLSNLKVLDLTRTSFKKSINPNLIPKLHRLETFHFLESNVYQSKPDFEETEFLREIGSLSRSTSLELQVYDPELCHIDIPGPWENLTRFQILVNHHRLGEFSSRGLWLEGIRGKQVANWVLVLLGRTYFLELNYCSDLESVTELGAAEGMNHNLKSLWLESCPKMECLINNMGLLESSSRGYEFSNLEVLEIRKMDVFVEICKGTNPPPVLLAKLKSLSFFSCYSLVTAIPRKLIHNLLNLKILGIYSCPNLLYVLQPEEEEKSEESLVSNICRISEPGIFPNLKIVHLYNIPKIRYVFTMRVARNLLHLEDLEIGSCSEMEVIFKYEDGEDIKCDQQFKDTPILPRLKELTVRKAPKLRTFTNQNVVMDLPSLVSLTVYECEILERLPFGTTSLPNLNYFERDDTELFDRLEWEDESVKSRLLAIWTDSIQRNLPGNSSKTPLKVMGNGLLIATPRKLIQNFLNLKSFKIEECLNLLPANGGRRRRSISSIKYLQNWNMLEWEDESVNSRLQAISL